MSGVQPALPNPAGTRRQQKRRGLSGFLCGTWERKTFQQLVAKFAKGSALAAFRLVIRADIIEYRSENEEKFNIRKREQRKIKNSESSSTRFAQNVAE